MAGRDNPSLREGLSTEVREALRNYLNAAVPTVLAQDDFSGQLKGHFATVIAQVGELSDLAVIEHLVDADIERVRTGRLARAADHRSKQGNGAVMSWTGWYVQAMIHLASDASGDLLSSAFDGSRLRTRCCLGSFPTGSRRTCFIALTAEGLANAKQRLQPYLESKSRRSRVEFCRAEENRARCRVETAYRDPSR
jgi:hypothetical protein